MADHDSPDSPNLADEGPAEGLQDRLRSALFLCLILVAVALAVSAVGLGLFNWKIANTTTRDRTVELAALKDCAQFVQEFRDLRTGEADDAAWLEFEGRTFPQLQSHMLKLQQRASATQPETQKLYWVTKYRLREMFEKCRTDPGPPETESLRLLQESAKDLKYELPDGF